MAVNPLLIAQIIGLAVQMGASIAGSSKKKRNELYNKRYNAKLEGIAEEERQEQENKARKDMLMNWIYNPEGASKGGMPNDYSIPRLPKPPEPPNYNTENMVGAIGGGIGQVAGYMGGSGALDGISGPFAGGDVYNPSSTISTESGRRALQKYIKGNDYDYGLDVGLA